MSLLPKIKAIFSIVTTLDKVQYEFKNGIILEVSEKFVITATNLLIYYIIVKVSYIGPLPITKLMFIYIKFKFLRIASCTYDGSV